MLIDFEKAFDTISWEFINQTLDFFNFGNKLTNGLIHFIKEYSHVFYRTGLAQIIYTLKEVADKGILNHPISFSSVQKFLNNNSK